MRLRSLLLISFALNAVLACVVLARWWPQPPASSGHPQARQAVPARIVRTASITNRQAPVTVEVSAPFHWSQVESADYRTYIENLRTIGCPEKTIYDIIVADVNDLYAGRVKALVDGVTGRFWEVLSRPPELEKLVEDKRQELDAIDTERKNTLRTLFHENNPGDWARERSQRAMETARRKAQLDYLSPDKIEQVQQADERLRTAWEEYSRANQGTPNAERQKKRQELVALRESEIQSLLTPAEYDEYKLRTVGVSKLPFDLANLDVTDQQVREIARAKLDSGDKGVQQLLGAEKFAEYERAKDNGYAGALRIVDRFDLPAETAAEVYQVRKAAMEQARGIRQDANRTVEEKQSLLRAMQAETERSLSAALGAQVFKVYQKYEGSWLSGFAENVR